MGISAMLAGLGTPLAAFGALLHCVRRYDRGHQVPRFLPRPRAAHLDHLLLGPVSLLLMCMAFSLSRASVLLVQDLWGMDSGFFRNIEFRLVSIPC